jgi:pimeloyl-ACP methyl ester carboxylesterase
MMGGRISQAACLAIAALMVGVSGCGRSIKIEEPARLAVHDEGNGQAIVLLHGMGDSSLGWRQTSEALLADQYRVIAWDALGAGDSPKPRDGDYSLRAHVARLEDILAEKELHDVVLVGHSLGGSMALVYTQQHPERVSKLVLVNPAAYREGAMKRRWIWDTPLLADVALGLAPRSMIVGKAMQLNFHNEELVTEEVKSAYLAEAKKPGTIRAFISQQRQLLPPDIDEIEQGYRHIEVPTLILWGNEDEILPVTQAERLAEDLPDARLVVLQQVGHSPHLEAPDRVAEEIVSFVLDERGGRGEY